MRRYLWIIPFLFLELAAIACTGGGPSPIVYVTASPVIPGIPTGEPTLPNPFIPTQTPRGPTATAIQPTPNPTYVPTLTTTQYTVQSGDNLASIANDFGTSLQAVLALNPGLTQTSVLQVGQVIMVPGHPSQTTPAFKIIPDSELVNSPGVRNFDVGTYIRFQPGFIRVYSEFYSGRLMSGAEIIQFFAQNTSVSPRLLLALLEYRSHWITNPIPDGDAIDYPLGLKDPRYKGLFQQVAWATNVLNGGYYGYKQRGDTVLAFPDNTRLAYAPSLNAGTVAVQYFLSRSVNRPVWGYDVSQQGFFTTYMSLFGDPFRNAVEPLIPPDLTQPTFQLPFAQGETWFLTAGPHGGWDMYGNSGWAAIDFAPPAPPDDIAAQGYCYVSPNYVLAAVGGIIARSADGIVVIDVDMDGDERTGWTLYYFHIADQDRIKAGTIVQPGSPLGHPSCEGFYLNAPATHVHIARRYNGEWIAADCWACAPGVAAPPFVLG
ncbi:MAG TPA: LysM domain-containing protein, partial [Aggregatilineales bacterium]|nr:LysM domain-containing protein [Aggregatilineales bacterium]